MAQTPSMFAYGENEHESYYCPIRASGRQVSGYRLEMADLFDSDARQLLEYDTNGYVSHAGIIARELAEQAWESVIKHYEHNVENAENDEECEEAEQRLQEAKEIRDDVFGEDE